MVKNIHIQYFAILREVSGQSFEVWQTTSETPYGLYAELRNRYGFGLTESHMRVAINGEFVDGNDYQLQDQDHVVFIPPVAGG